MDTCEGKRAGCGVEPVLEGAQDIGQQRRGIGPNQRIFWREWQAGFRALFEEMRADSVAEVATLHGDVKGERLAELEAEITTLRESASATDVDSDDSELKAAYDHAMSTIDELMAEKQEVEEARMVRIELQDQRIADLEAMLKQLLANAEQ